MDAVSIQAALDDVFDQAIAYHAYTDYMRDYEVITYSVAGPRAGSEPAYDRYVFRDCVDATVTTALSADIWRRSRDDRLLDADPGPNADGYVWGVRWQVLYPGGTVVEDSKRARRWSGDIGVAFHEVHLGTNAYDITLVFSDLHVERLPVGYSPFMVREERNGQLAPTLDLVVVRSPNLAVTREFYEALGVVFVDEQHGDGPRHLAGILGNGVVLEIYPASPAHPTVSEGPAEPRWGFVVADIDTALGTLQAAGGTVTAAPSTGNRSRHATITDPDGRPIHITSHR